MSIRIHNWRVVDSFELSSDLLDRLVDHVDNISNGKTISFSSIYDDELREDLYRFLESRGIQDIEELRIHISW